MSTDQEQILILENKLELIETLRVLQRFSNIFISLFSQAKFLSWSIGSENNELLLPITINKQVYVDVWSKRKTGKRTPLPSPIVAQY